MTLNTGTKKGKEHKCSTHELNADEEVVLIKSKEQEPTEQTKSIDLWVTFARDAETRMEIDEKGKK